MSVINGVCEFCNQTVLDGTDCNCYQAKEEKKTVSLIKRKTNFDRIKEMDVYELSRVLMCPCEMDIETNWTCKGGSCIDCVKKWLESEV